MARLLPDRSRSSRCFNLVISDGMLESALWLRYKLMRNVNENRPDVGGRFLMFTPPMSSDVHVFSEGFGAVFVGLSATEATAVDPPVAELELGDDPVAVAFDNVEADVPFASPSFAVPLVSGALTALGFVMGIADFCTVLEAIALARARWCGDLDARII